MAFLSWVPKSVADRYVLDALCSSVVGQETASVTSGILREPSADWPVFYFSPSLRQSVGIQFQNTWWNFGKRVIDADPHPYKDRLSRWAPVQFVDSHRRRDNIVRCYAVVLDVDKGAELEGILASLDALYVIAHSTFSATTEAPRWRVIVPLDRGVDADEYDRLWRWLAAKLEKAGIEPDYAARDAGHCWAIPARPPSGHYVAHMTNGAFAECAEGLRQMPPPGKLPEPTETRGSGDLDQRRLRASRYLGTVPGAIAGSHGHAATMKAALVLVRGFSLPVEDALALLVKEYNARCAPPWTVRELRHKCVQAFQRGKMPFGLLAEKERNR